MSVYRILSVLVLIGGVSGAAVPAVAQAPEISVRTVATCNGNDAQFEIVNMGERWPGMAKVALLRADNHAVISERVIRMATGQSVKFRAREAPDTIGVGLWIEPDWYTREFAFDEVIHCE